MFCTNTLENQAINILLYHELNVLADSRQWRQRGGNRGYVRVLGKWGEVSVYIIRDRIFNDQCYSTEKLRFIWWHRSMHAQANHVGVQQQALSDFRTNLLGIVRL